MMTLGALALIATQLMAPAPAATQGPVVEAKHDAASDETLLTVRSDNGTFRELMGVITFEISAASGRTIELVGMEKLARNPRVEVFLIERPWRDALRWIAGSAGFAITTTSSRIEVVEAAPDFATGPELNMRALMAYRQILGDYPDAPRADALWLASGRIAETLGPDFYTSALSSYETLAEEFPSSEFVWEAMTASGHIYGLLGEWDKAAIRFHEVADSPVVHAYHVEARLALANALCEVGERESNPLAKEDDGNKAALTLQALDRHYPTDSAKDQRERAILMGRALALTADPVEALRALDVAAERSPFGPNDLEILAVRAKALGRAGRHGDASTAWLAVARQATGKELENAYVQAAEEALAGGHELAVLAIHRRAVDLGFGRRLEPAQLEAKLRLGIATEVEGYSLSQQLSRALQLARVQQTPEALRALRPIYLRRSELTPDRRMDLALGFARVLDAESLTREAIETLRVMASETQSAMDKRQIYTLAAQIYESHGDFESAIEALKGTL